MTRRRRDWFIAVFALLVLTALALWFGDRPVDIGEMR